MDVLLLTFSLSIVAHLTLYFLLLPLFSLRERENMKRMVVFTLLGLWFMVNMGTRSWAQNTPTTPTMHSEVQARATAWAEKHVVVSGEPPIHEIVSCTSEAKEGGLFVCTAGVEDFQANTRVHVIVCDTKDCWPPIIGVPSVQQRPSGSRNIR